MIYSLDELLSQFGTSSLFPSGSDYCFLTCIQVSQETGKVAWYSYLFKNFPVVVIHTLKRVSLIAHLVKYQPAMQDTLVRFLGWEDPLEQG